MSHDTTITDSLIHRILQFVLFIFYLSLLLMICTMY